MAALATPQPLTQRQGGCTHAASDVGVATSVFHVARWVAVTSAAKAAVRRSGKMWRAYWNFAGPKQDRMSACAPWVSAKTATVAHVRANFPFIVSR